MEFVLEAGLLHKYIEGCLAVFKLDIQQLDIQQLVGQPEGTTPRIYTLNCNPYCLPGLLIPRPAEVISNLTGIIIT